MEVRQRVREVVVEDGWALIKVSQVPDRPGIATQIFEAISAGNISVDMVLQNASVERSTDLSFTVKEADLEHAMRLLAPVREQIGAKEVDAIERLAKIELVGTGILSDPAYIGQLFQTLADADVNILAIGTSEIRISCLVEGRGKERAREALHRAFLVGPPA